MKIYQQNYQIYDVRRFEIKHREEKHFCFISAINQANGSWSENALSYDCRSMLFKALHNMIEK
jgi:hypothetical protein